MLASFDERWSGEMAYASDQNDLPCRVGGNSPARHGAADKPVGFLRHIFDAVLEWGDRDGDQASADLLARSGGRLTDSIEREMMQRRTTSNWTIPG
ncbi:hypothetical protein SAMN05444161_1285 [Rhizobiales bacterium GAS191]|jgi:hypothetical protein|nr:hypothetical protein SAMN05444161_1285 [Rhizobiales bacterium GAS191]SEC75149.1 hypothetical protein SAMN05519104_2013 [Rhizobiales bacterium GAS188]